MVGVRYRLSAWLGALIILLASAPAWGQDKPSAEAGLDVLSQYIWRGYALSNDSVVIEPSLTVSYKGAYVNVWGNYDTNEDDEGRGIAPQAGQADWSETDFTVGYTYDKLPYGISLDVGTIYYALDAVDDSFEVYAGLSATCPLTGIDFDLTIYREVSHYPGWWIELSAAKSFALPWYKARLDLGATVIYQASDDAGSYADPDNPNDEYSAWHSANLSVAVSIPVGEYFTVTPQVGYWFALSSDAKKVIETTSWEPQHDYLYGGIGISMTW
ncbi:TorF family putative porin [Thermosulfuriphilus sp.]